MNSPALETREIDLGKAYAHRNWRQWITWILVALFATVLAVESASAQQPLPSQPTPAKPATRPDTTKKPLPDLPKAPGVRQDYHPPALGLQLRNLEASERKALDVKSGVYVERAIGSAGSAGVKAEDVITKVNGRPVTDVDRFWKLAETSGWKFTATIVRGKTLISIAIDAT